MTEFPFQYEYPRPAVAVDLVVIRSANAGNREILLIERGRDPYAGHWALPGGFLNEDETLEQGAARELMEETGVAIAPADLIQIKAYSRLDRDPRTRVISVAFIAPVPAETDAIAADDAANARWFHVNDMPALAFDHSEIIRDSDQHLFK